MRATFFRIATALMFVGCVFGASRTAHADTHFSLQIGAPVVVAPPVVVRPAPFDPYNDYYWVPAYRTWTGFEYRWVPGRWARRGYRNEGRWDNRRWEHERDSRDERRNFDDRGRWHR